MKKITSYIYKSIKKQDTYIYLLEKDKFDCLPDKLSELLGQFEFVMDLELDQQRVLAQVDVIQVIEQLNNVGYFVQFPKDLSKMAQAKSVTDYSLSG